MQTTLAALSITAFSVVIVYALYVATGNVPFFSNRDMLLIGVAGAFCAVVMVLRDA